MLLVPAGTLVPFTPDIFEHFFQVGLTVFPLVRKGTLTVMCLLLELDNTVTLYKIVSKALMVQRSLCPLSSNSNSLSDSVVLSYVSRTLRKIFLSESIQNQ